MRTLSTATNKAAKSNPGSSVRQSAVIIQPKACIVVPVFPLGASATKGGWPVAGGFPPRHLAPVDPGLCPGWGAEMNGEAHERTALLLISSPSGRRGGKGTIR